MRSVALFAVMLLATAACGGDDFPSDADRPPGLLVAAGEEGATLTSYAYCWSRREGASTLNVCTDGIPEEPLPSLTLHESAELSVRFPLPWLMTAIFRPKGDECGAAASRIEVDINGAAIDVPGPAGVYRVELFGRGAEGDGSWAFELTTIEPGSIAPPSIQVFWHPAAEELDPQTSFSAFISNVFGGPASVSADITVAAGNGATGDFALTQVVSTGCDGEIGFDGDPMLTTSIMNLGPPPYEITVSATIEGNVVTSDPVVWPDDFPDNGNESRRVETAVVSP